LIIQIREDKKLLKKTRILILAAMTATVMLLGSTAVFAADAISGTVASVPVTKTVTVAEGITVPATTFTIEAVQVANAADEPAPPVAPTGVKATVGTLEVASGASG